MLAIYFGGNNLYEKICLILGYASWFISISKTVINKGDSRIDVLSNRTDGQSNLERLRAPRKISSIIELLFEINLNSSTHPIKYVHLFCNADTHLNINYERLYGSKCVLVWALNPGNCIIWRDYRDCGHNNPTPATFFTKPTKWHM